MYNITLRYVHMCTVFLYWIDKHQISPIKVTEILVVFAYLFIYTILWKKHETLMPYLSLPWLPLV